LHCYAVIPFYFTTKKHGAITLFTIASKISFMLFSVSDVAEVMSRIVRYLSGANHVMLLPLAEVILTNKDKG